MMCVVKQAAAAAGHRLRWRRHQLFQVLGVVGTVMLLCGTIANTANGLLLYPPSTTPPLHHYHYRGPDVPERTSARSRGFRTAESRNSNNNNNHHKLRCRHHHHHHHPCGTDTDDDDGEMMMSRRRRRQLLFLPTQQSMPRRARAQSPSSRLPPLFLQKGADDFNDNDYDDDETTGNDSVVARKMSSSSSDDYYYSKGVAVLLTVPVAWGTFEVAVRYVYALRPAVPAFLFSLAYYAVATAALFAAVMLQSWFNTLIMMDKKNESNDTSNGNNSNSDGADVVASSLQGENQNRNKVIVAGPPQDDDDTASDEWPVAGGLELGSYLFAGNLLQLVGLQTVASDRAAFLLQLTTVFVPLAQAGFFDKDKGWASVSIRVWMACAVALAGVGVMGLDGGGGDSISSSSSSSGNDSAPAVIWSHLASFDGTAAATTVLQQQLQWSTGDTLIVLAAVAYTFHCIRLEVFAQTTSAVKLAACKASTETAWSALAVAFVVAFATAAPPSAASISSDDTNKGAMISFLATSGQDCLDFVSAVSDGSMATSDGTASTLAVLLPAALAVVWTGLVPVAYTIAAQSYGQSRVRPVTANLIYTIQPICTALFAYILLHETLGVAGYIGGALIGSAVLLVVAPGDDDAVASTSIP